MTTYPYLASFSREFLGSEIGYDAVRASLVSCRPDFSSIVACSLIQPFIPAALIIEYSPLTW